VTKVVDGLADGRGNSSNGLGSVLDASTIAGAKGGARDGVRGGTEAGSKGVVEAGTETGTLSKGEDVLDPYGWDDEAGRVEAGTIAGGEKP